MEPIFDIVGAAPTFPLILEWPATARIGVQIDDIIYHDGDIMRVRYDTRYVLLASIAPALSLEDALALCSDD